MKHFTQWMGKLREILWCGETKQHPEHPWRYIRYGDETDYWCNGV